MKKCVKVFSDGTCAKEESSEQIEEDLKTQTEDESCWWALIEGISSIEDQTRLVLIILLALVFACAGRYLARRGCTRLTLTLVAVFVVTALSQIVAVLFKVPCRSALIAFCVQSLYDLHKVLTPAGLLSLIVAVIVISTTWTSMV